MEFLGIGLALIAGLFAAPLFCFVVAKLVRPIRILAAPCFWISLTLLFFFFLELLLTSTQGIIRARQLVGPSFFLLHALLTFSAAPALACAALLSGERAQRRWALTAAVCWLVGAGAIFYQYAVAEELYGIDGIGGPFVAPF